MTSDRSSIGTEPTFDSAILKIIGTLSAKESGFGMKNTHPKSEVQNKIKVKNKIREYMYNSKNMIEREYNSEIYLNS